MLDVIKMKPDCRPPISRRKTSKPDKVERSPSVQMATRGTIKQTSRKPSNISLTEKENTNSVEMFEDFKISKDTEIKSLKDILLSNLNLVEQQERLLGIREKEIVQLKRENETLRCRLERMDRRVSLTKAAASPDVASPPPQQVNNDVNRAVKRKSTLEPQSLAKKFASIARHEYEKDQQKGRELGSARKETPEKRTPRKHTPTSHIKRRSLKERFSNYEASPSKRFEESEDVRITRLRQPSTPQRNESESFKSNFVTGNDKNETIQNSAKKSKNGTPFRKDSRIRKRVRIPKDEAILKTNIEYYVAQDPAQTEIITPKQPEKEHVVVPSFRIKRYTPYFVIDGRENFEDEVYLERHKKPENEEKKRKRWDLQQQREEEQRRKLLCSQRYQDTKLQNSNASKDDKNSADFTSFVPDPLKIEYIEVCDELPVSVFGYPLPTASSKTQEFSLPWFDVEKRDKEEQKKTRGRKR